MDVIAPIIILPCFFFIAIGFVIAVVSTLILISLSIIDEQKRKAAAWQKLAEANHLVKPGGLTQPQIVGDYRGHHLNLDTYQRKEGGSYTTYTRLVLTMDHRGNGHLLPGSKDTLNGQAALKDIDSLLTPNGIRYRLKEKIKIREDKQQLSYKQTGFETNTEYLQFLFDLLADLADAYPTVLALGGEVVPALYEIAGDDDDVLQLIAIQLLNDIGRETKSRLSDRAERLLCPNCLTCCDEHKVRLPWWKSVTYYGCRICGQSRDFFESQLVAVLDSQMETEQSQQDGVLRVNWLDRRTLFDFDEVKIIQATDEDVERFAVQVGNDTDPKRKPRYEEMRCVVSPECQLSENTLRILERMFGQVEMGELER